MVWYFIEAVDDDHMDDSSCGDRGNDCSSATSFMPLLEVLLELRVLRRHRMILWRASGENGLL